MRVINKKGQVKQHWGDPGILTEFGEFWDFLTDYWYKKLYRGYRYFEGFKDGLVDLLYQRRGKYSRPFVHAGMVVLVFLGITIGPLLLESVEDPIQASELPGDEILGLSTEDTMEMGMRTIPSEGVLEYRGGEIVDYTVESGETLSIIAEKFSLQVDTILWANGLDSDKVKIKKGQTLKIPPVDGVIHKVKKGETVYSIAKKYNTNPQGMVDYPFNEFTNDETFALAIGQVLMVPDGVMPQPEVAPAATIAKILTPDAGAVSVLGAFVWPASGGISQGYRFYHKAIDIANSGRVTVAGWPSNEGYGNRVMIDHGNGYVTLYAHMSKITVAPGQTVNRGDTIGYMGSTGRSTGVHLHFEIRAGGSLQNPLNFLK
jgi:murein DD-endopeptidase MepM/ murein hydrolase activator NlpD